MFQGVAARGFFSIFTREQRVLYKGKEGGGVSLMSDICFSIFISFSLKKKETGTEHSLYKDTKTFKRNPVIFSPYHPNIYTWKIRRKKTKLDVLLFSPLLIFLNPTVLMLTLCYFFFLLTIKVVQDTSSLIISLPFWGAPKILWRKEQESIKESI